MSEYKVIVWFRQDLRLNDNPALFEASKLGSVLPIYIFDDEQIAAPPMGSASRCWLHHALTSLNDSLDNNLCIYQGNAQNVLNELVARLDINAVYWNRCYEPWRIKQSTIIKKSLVNVFRVLTVDKIIEIGSEEDVWSKGKKTKKWKAFTSERIHRINEENIDQISSKRVRLIDEKKLKEYHLLGILINAVRGRSNLLEYWMEIFLDAFIERTEQLETKAMKNANELKNTDDFTDEDMEKTLLLLKAIKGELFNVGFLGRYMDPNNPTGVYFRDVNEINEFLDKIGAEFEYIVSNPGEKPYLQHKITPNDTV